MNLARNPNDKHSLKVRRKLANLNPDYLETLACSPSRQFWRRELTACKIAPSGVAWTVCSFWLNELAVGVA